MSVAIHMFRSESGRVVAFSATVSADVRANEMADLGWIRPFVVFQLRFSRRFGATRLRVVAERVFSDGSALASFDVARKP